MEGIGLTATGVVVLLLSALIAAPGLARGQYDDDGWSEWPQSWVNQGGDITNRREAKFETKISTETVTSLALKWTAQAGFDVPATPAIDACLGVVYFSSWDGCQYAVKKDTGERIWKVNLTVVAATIPDLANVAPFTILYVSRSTPTIAGPLLVFGLYNPCYVFALNRTSGALVWWRSLETTPFCVVTQSGTYHNQSIYIGTSSAEEELGNATTCCTFQGKFFKLDANTGKILWQVRMLPDNHGQTGLYAGASVWGSSPSIDVSRRLVYIATGNDYSTPPDVQACEEARMNETHPTIPDPCLLPDDYSESILGIDIDTGNITWARHLGAYDTWTAVCQLNPVQLPNCPKIYGPDADFGEAPFLLTIKENGSGWRWRDVVTAGQKSGIVHTLDRETGEIVWQTVAGPGGGVGGASYGMSTDGERVYTSIINSDGSNFTLVPSSTVITWGGWVAMNASTGKVIWSTANPVQLSALSPVAYANGVVFGSSVGNASSPTGTPSGQIVALDAMNGTILWEYTTPGGLVGGVSILDGCIFQPVGGTPTGFFGNWTNPAIHGNTTLCLCVP
ncbi:unnamed protein product [Calypogeia fissa]